MVEQEEEEKILSYECFGLIAAVRSSASSSCQTGEADSSVLLEWRHKLTEERLDEAIKIPIADATMCIVK